VCFRACGRFLPGPAVVFLVLILRRVMFSLKGRMLRLRLLLLLVALMIGVGAAPPLQRRLILLLLPLLLPRCGVKSSNDACQVKYVVPPQ